MIEDILGGGIQVMRRPADCGCDCTNKCTSAPDYSQGYQAGNTDVLNK